MSEFNKLPLHDAVLYKIIHEWDDRRVIFSMSAFVNVRENAIPHELIFSDVTMLIIPAEWPWASSDCINRVEIVDDEYQLEIQSGDVIRVKASGFQFLPSSAASGA